MASGKATDSINAFRSILFGRQLNLGVVRRLYIANERDIENKREILSRSIYGVVCARLFEGKWDQMNQH